MGLEEMKLRRTDCLSLLIICATALSAGCVDRVSQDDALLRVQAFQNQGQSKYILAMQTSLPKSLWRMGTVSGNSIQDIFGGNTGNLIGGYSTGIPGALVQETNTAIQFNGLTGFMHASRSTDVGSSFSLEFWFQTQDIGGGMLSLNSNSIDASSASDRQIYLTGDGHVVFAVKKGELTSTAESPTSLNDGNWHHIAGTYTNVSGLRLYVDGRLASQGPSIEMPSKTSGFWRVGFSNNQDWLNGSSNHFFKGSIDEAAVYDQELPAGQVRNHYLIGKNQQQ